MKGKQATHYYQASGFSPYYFAHVIYNVVRTPGAYIGNLEEILGDMRTEGLCNPFPRYSNLHLFIEDVIEDVFFEHDKEDPPVLYDFLVYAGLADKVLDKHDIDELADIRNEDERYQPALQNLIEEVFHILFVNIVFLQRFNELVAGYISHLGEGYKDSGGDLFTIYGRLKRVAVPTFAKDAVYHRDQGECRICKKAVDRLLRPEEKERYDHIVPLAAGGANDVTNLQLLCQRCNSDKSARSVEASSLYRRSYPIRN